MHREKVFTKNIKYNYFTIKLKSNYIFIRLKEVCLPYAKNMLLILNTKAKNSTTYPCKFPIRDHARNAGPPKKSPKSEMLKLNFSCRLIYEVSY